MVGVFGVGEKKKLIASEDRAKIFKVGDDIDYKQETLPPILTSYSDILSYASLRPAL